MKKLLSLAIVTVLLTGLSAEAMAERPLPLRLPGTFAPSRQTAPAVAAKLRGDRGSQISASSDDNHVGSSELLEAQLVPATGGMATTLASAKLEVSAQGEVDLKIEGLAGSSGPITDTGTLEIDIVVNGTPAAPSPTFSVPLVNGNATVSGTLPVAQGDVVEITAFRILDSSLTELLRTGGKIGSAAGGQFQSRGSISNLGGTCPDTTFSVNGLVVTTDGNTQYEHGACATLAPGILVKVEGLVLSNGTHLATKVEFNDD